MEEALKLVESLNNDSYVDDQEFDWQELYEFVSTGNQCGIKFLGVMIWHDDNDGREWVSEHVKEPLRDFIIRESKMIQKNVNERLKLL